MKEQIEKIVCDLCGITTPPATLTFHEVDIKFDIRPDKEGGDKVILEDLCRSCHEDIVNTFKGRISRRKV